jgi:hypothetical protein
MPGTERVIAFSQLAVKGLNIVAVTVWLLKSLEVETLDGKIEDNIYFLTVFFSREATLTPTF